MTNARSRMAPSLSAKLAPPLAVACSVAMSAAFLGHAPARAQTFASEDPVLRGIWEESMHRSRLEPMGRALLDSIGPRLTASPGMERAQDWAVERLERWGLDARQELYGTWEGWERGTAHVELVGPRTRSLEGRLLAWSPGTGGGPVEAEVLALPELSSTVEWDAFLRSVPGRWVMLSFPQPTCRPDDQWLEFQRGDAGRRMAERRQAEARTWARSLTLASDDGRLPSVHAALEEAGAAGIVTSDWPGTPGTVRVMEAYNRRTPTFELSCEDYGLVHRLARGGGRPVLRLSSDARSLGVVPVFNVVGELRGAELPDEYVVLSAHLDSWDAASGATDNGAGVLQMMEAVRVLTEVYPRPRRTLLIALWSGEEQGLQGSGAYAEDHPEVLEGIQALFNQDSGTGRVVLISAQGFPEAGRALEEWLDRVPGEVTEYLETDVPGTPAGGSDYGSFVCRGVPAFPMGALPWDYSSHTWHSNRDTYDKLVFEDLRANVVLTASLAYLASEHPGRVGRERRLHAGPAGGTADGVGTAGAWPACRPVLRSPPSAAGPAPRSGGPR